MSKLRCGFQMPWDAFRFQLATNNVENMHRFFNNVLGGKINETEWFPDEKKEVLKQLKSGGLDLVVVHANWFQRLLLKRAWNVEIRKNNWVIVYPKNPSTTVDDFVQEAKSFQF